ncbi:survival factor 1 [Coprinopsis cinerea okayama7|uniref:Survival factor 1 n=1 Tax=Coprinopsis cinerea (strain Okayama-7 / 130 / ATCC MYA-4618 / FGSC 9003) TaxID=240176 RepID=A8NTT0_COPC7|nr:survival factor 1 [Coprinopsis cinerea okayama7\|eukprot:XP_001836295.2 survival factor 1 [Coprinopsis cinerea okayama7\
MFSSLFSAAPVDPHAPNFFSATTNVPENELFGPLEPKDTEWLCAGGFVTETQTFYTITDDGVSIMCQVIHSATGVWYPTVQFTFKVHDPKTGKTIWKSVNVSNFTSSPPGLDKRSCKADEFTLTYKPTNNPEYPETYVVNANLAADLQFSMEFQRIGTVPGWKLGKGPKAGYSYFGPDLEKPEGYVIHRFWPRFKASGHIISEGKADTVQGVGMFIHAIQGMRPNLVASAWNFHHFESEELGGVSALQMEFTTCDTHGKKGSGSGRVSVNIGSLVIGNKLAVITAETAWPGEARPADPSVISRTTHLDTQFDQETGYKKPSRQIVEWKGPSILADAPGTVTGKVEVDVGDVENPKGLIEKIDVLAEIPYVLKVAVNYVAGTKPYIYQWINPAKLHISGPDAIAPGLSSGIDVNGTLYSESTFIS